MKIYGHNFVKIYSYNFVKIYSHNFLKIYFNNIMKINSYNIVKISNYNIVITFNRLPKNISKMFWSYFKILWQLKSNILICIINNISTIFWKYNIAMWVYSLTGFVTYFTKSKIKLIELVLEGIAQNYKDHVWLSDCVILDLENLDNKRIFHQ